MWILWMKTGKCMIVSLFITTMFPVQAAFVTTGESGVPVDGAPNRF